MFCENAKYFYKKMMLRVNKGLGTTQNFALEPLRRGL